MILRTMETRLNESPLLCGAGDDGVHTHRAGLRLLPDGDDVRLRLIGLSLLRIADDRGAEERDFALLEILYGADCDVLRAVFQHCPVGGAEDGRGDNEDGEQYEKYDLIDLHLCSLPFRTYPDTGFSWLS